MNNKINLDDNLWQLYNEYSIKGIMIISYADFKKAVERIYIQTHGVSGGKSE